MNRSKVVDLRILSKEFKVTCPEGAEKELKAAATYLDQKMREIRSGGRVIGLERIAVMAALNITHELLVFKEQREAYARSVTNQIEGLQNKLDDVLSEQ